MEDKELLLSLAHGSAYWEKGMEYKEVVQAADESMYARKNKMKADYGFTR